MSFSNSIACSMSRFARNYAKIPTGVRRFASASGAEGKTPLYNWHIEKGATMAPFAGFSMPIVYPKIQSHIESHNWVRSSSGLFDVSHMVQHIFSGSEAKAMLERLTPIDLEAMTPGTGSLTVLLNDDGGIVDDTIVTKLDDSEYYVVTNAGCREGDLAYFKQAIETEFSQVRHTVLDDGLVALQGPKSAEVLNSLTQFDLSTLKFGHNQLLTIAGIPGCRTARGGYTGEDGFEISAPADRTAELADALISANGGGVVQPAGLAARDSLRLEAGMCLYGSDITKDTTPIEASLTWVVAKGRRSPPRNDFRGAEVVLKQIADKSAAKRRVGLVATGRGPPARGHAKIFAAGAGPDAEPIGEVTSGLPSPTLQKNIAMGYVKKGFHSSGTEVELEIRKKRFPAVVSKMPFVPTHYFR
ncbi:hypothetical protein CANCADRAFT_2238 [Tortispora caseinolytica NRRL Y-17796]|uniref:Aminomethyltransferase n=1 Tax=Tortispora caseinolytica NRRL Y-17796 TaxID=767744 RepID=A0A1E4TFG0_9ASCO|nr:hypothetical protein CANCADRAFT_2238 [Tortispora caseinolytica NRRL Y-17796]